MFGFIIILKQLHFHIYYLFVDMYHIEALSFSSVFLTDRASIVSLIENETPKNVTRYEYSSTANKIQKAGEPSSDPVACERISKINFIFLMMEPFHRT
jgi:hypothetical protein